MPNVPHSLAGRQHSAHIYSLNSVLILALQLVSDSLTLTGTGVNGGTDMDMVKSGVQGREHRGPWLSMST